MFDSIINSGSLTIYSVSLCILVGLVCGLIIAVVHLLTSQYNKNFAITLAILPLLVGIVIMMVNGNLGTSVAVLGAFSLIRFRSIPGNSKEITNIFFAMAIGLAVGMGQIYFALLITIIISLLLLIFNKTSLLERKQVGKYLTVLIPEDLDYEEVFNDLFDKYTSNHLLMQMKTINMGSVIELKYQIQLKKDVKEKSFLDDLRVRNGNLKISLTHPIEAEML